MQKAMRIDITQGVNGVSVKSPAPDALLGKQGWLRKVMPVGVRQEKLSVFEYYIDTDVPTFF